MSTVPSAPRCDGPECPGGRAHKPDLDHYLTTAEADRLDDAMARILLAWARIEARTIAAERRPEVEA